MAAKKHRGHKKENHGCFFFVPSVFFRGHAQFFRCGCAWRLNSNGSNSSIAVVLPGGVSGVMWTGGVDSATVGACGSRSGGELCATTGVRVLLAVATTGRAISLRRWGLLATTCCAHSCSNL